MKKNDRSADPNIDKASNLLRQYESTARDKYVNAKKANARAPPQTIEDRRRNDKYIDNLDLYKG